MNILFWALTLGTIGKVMVAIGVMLAHAQLVHEHRIDGKVLKAFRIEHTITLIGVVLIVLAYFLELYFYGFTPFHDCDLDTCGAALRAAISQ